MSKSNRKKIKEIKKAIRKNKLSKETNLFLSNVALIFDTNLVFSELFELERELIKNRSARDWSIFYSKCGLTFTKPFDACDWASFGVFAYYLWNQKLFLKKKTRELSIYTYDNFNELNEIKSKNYNSWMNSMLATKNKDFNIYVRRVLDLI